MRIMGVFVAVLAMGCAGCGNRVASKKQSHAPVEPQQKRALAAADGSPWTTVVESKPLSNQIEKGLQYLANQQLENGGWGQGGGWRMAEGSQGRVEPGAEGYQQSTDVGNSAIALLTFVRAGNTPTRGPYKDNVRRGVEYLLASIDASDDESMYVTDVRGTQIQHKIGAYADTFLSLTTLAELKGQMPTDEANERLVASLDRVIGKIETNQQDDGSYDGNQGWASVLSQSFGNKGLNRAKQAGVRVSAKTLENIESSSSGSYSVTTRSFSSEKGSGKAAGVTLYEESAALAGMADSDNSAAQDEAEAQKIATSKRASAVDKKRAKERIRSIKKRRAVKQAATETVANKLGDQQFVAGFGSAGGEEYISYMNISETLAAQGGEAWKKWDGNVTAALNEAQNEDGSWVGHHCITGRTFVTASALLTLMADRAPVPVEVAKLAAAQN